MYNCLQVRLDLAQANDAERFASNQAETQHAAELRRAAVTRAALVQPPNTNTPLCQQVALLWALQQGYLDDSPVELVPVRLLKKCFCTTDSVFENTVNTIWIP